MTAMSDPAAVTALLQAWRAGDNGALAELVPVVHGELRRLALRYMAAERSDHTLQVTALVNEAYIRLVDLKRMQWQDRVHFFAMSARLMRRILVDHARTRGFEKRGGAAERVPLDDGLLVADHDRRDLVALDVALSDLAAADERKARVVELRFFGGLSVKETALVLGISVETVGRDWRLAKAWLARELTGGHPHAG